MKNYGNHKCQCLNDIFNLYEIIKNLENKMNNLEQKIIDMEIRHLSPMSPLPSNSTPSVMNDFNNHIHNVESYGYLDD